MFGVWIQIEVALAGEPKVPGVFLYHGCDDFVGGQLAQALALFAEVFVGSLSQECSQMTGIEQLALFDVDRSEQNLGKPLAQQCGRGNFKWQAQGVFPGIWNRAEGRTEE